MATSSSSSKALILVLHLLILSTLLFSASSVTDLSNSPPYYDLRYECSNTAGNYTNSSAYQANLESVLATLARDTTIDYGFYNFSSAPAKASAASDDDTVYSIALCRGGLASLDMCRGCVNESAHNLYRLCPRQKEAIIWYDACMLRFSNAPIYGSLQYSPTFTWGNLADVSNGSRFTEVLGDLLATLSDQAAAGDSRRKFQTGEAKLSALETFYALVQCTPDLSEGNCSSCLQKAREGIPGCCRPKQGGRVYYPSCFLRFELYSFYSSTPRSPPPALPPTTNVSSNSSTNAGEGMLHHVQAPMYH